jgi:hypothetical protein
MLMAVLPNVIFKASYVSRFYMYRQLGKFPVCLKDVLLSRLH